MMLNRIAVLTILLSVHGYLIHAEDVCSDESLEGVMRPIYEQVERLKTQLGGLATGACCACHNYGGAGLPEVKHCTPDKAKPLGMDSFQIRDKDITASTYFGNDPSEHSPQRARPRTTGFAAAWSKENGDSHPWIQVDLRTKVYFTGLTTYGRRSNNDNHNQWVTKYNVQYSNVGQPWTYLMAEGESKAYEFTGNTDRDTPVDAVFPAVVHARFIRILPIKWHDHCSMRFEVFGCS